MGANDFKWFCMKMKIATNLAKRTIRNSVPQLMKISFRASNLGSQLKRAGAATFEHWMTKQIQNTCSLWALPPENHHLDLHEMTPTPSGNQTWQCKFSRYRCVCFIVVFPIKTCIEFGDFPASHLKWHPFGYISVGDEATNPSICWLMTNLEGPRSARTYTTVFNRCQISILGVFLGKMTRNIYGKFWVNFNNLTADRDVTLKWRELDSVSFMKGQASWEFPWSAAHVNGSTSISWGI